MPVLIYIAWATFGIAGLLAFAGAILEDLIFLVAAIAVAISGVLFLALDRIVSALDAIRAQIAPPAAATTQPSLQIPASAAPGAAAERHKGVDPNARRSWRARAKNGPAAPDSRQPEDPDA